MTKEKTVKDFAKTIDLLKKTVSEASAKHLRETAQIWALNTPEKAKRILSECRKKRHRKHLEDFHAYTHSPCGCYRDPGGHP